MISHADAPKHNIMNDQSQARLNERVREESHRDDGNESNSKFESPIIVGTQTTKYYYNNIIEYEYIEPITIGGHDDWLDLLDQLLNSKSKMQITTVDEEWDDVPSPTPQQMAEAESIMDKFEIPLPPIPKVPPSNEPSWD